MPISIEKIRSEFVKHRVKSCVLLVLALVMAGLFVKAGAEMRPRVAVAEPVVSAAAEVTPEAAADAEDRIRQSQQLWKVLKEARGGLVASSAFTFDGTYFPPDPNKPFQKMPDVAEPVISQPATPRVTVTTEEMERSARISATREQARALIVRSTVVGNGNSKPIAVVNGHILTVGDRISGFEIVSIRAREVEFKKDGITLAVKMADDSSGQ